MENDKYHQKTANLALQGGGSHGAFAWGVLDRLLEERRLSIEGITATSAGALNAVAFAYGLSVGGREGAKDLLNVFWKRISSIAASQMLRPTAIDKLYGNFGLDNSPSFRLIEVLCQFLSPYQFNPFDYNPLRNLVEDLVDFDRLRKRPAIKLFLCATNVRTGKLKVFEGGEISVKHVMAACCRPLLTRAVEIDGEYYWDGAFIANPPIFPVIYGCELVRHHPCPPYPDYSTKGPGHSARHPQSHAGDQLQFIADARNAGDRFYEQAD